jgi:hypothetical protein
LTPNAAIIPAKGDYEDAADWVVLLCVKANAKKYPSSLAPPEHLLEICDVVLRLLAASVVHSVVLNKTTGLAAWMNATSLGYLMEHCQSLKCLTLEKLDMDESHCRRAWHLFDQISRSSETPFTGAGASALVEVLTQSGTDEA